MLQGMGGSLSEEDLKKFGPILASQGPMPTPSLDGNLIQAGSTGNAAGPLAGYLNKTSTGNPVISYVPPHLRPEDDAPEDGEGSPNDGITDGEDPIDSDGDGIPDTILPPGGFYDVGGGGDNPDGMGGQVGDVSYYGGGYNSFTDMFDGGGPGMFGGQHQGMFSGIGNAISGVLGQDNIANTGNISYAYTPASNNSVNTAPHPGIQYTAPAAAVLGLEDPTVANWSAGQVDMSGAEMGDGIATGGFEGYGQSAVDMGGPDVSGDDGTAGTGGYGMFNQGGPVEYYAKGSMCPKCGKPNCGCGYSQGGPVQYKKYGGSIWDTEEDLQILQPSLPQAQRRNAAGGSKGNGLLSQAGGMASSMIMKAALTPILGPFAALFNEGGSVKNTPVLGPLGTLTNNPNMLVPEHEAYKESSLGPSLGPLSNKQMKMKSYMKDEARKDMKFAIDEKRKQELHMKKLRS